MRFIFTTTLLFSVSAHAMYDVINLMYRPELTRIAREHLGNISPEHAKAEGLVTYRTIGKYIAHQVASGLYEFTSPGRNIADYLVWVPNTVSTEGKPVPALVIFASEWVAVGQAFREGPNVVVDIQEAALAKRAEGRWYPQQTIMTFSYSQMVENLETRNHFLEITRNLGGRIRCSDIK